MPIWLIILVVLLTFYFTLSGWYTFMWAMSMSSTRRQVGLFNTILSFFISPLAIGAIIAFSFVLPYLDRQPVVHSFLMRLKRRFASRPQTKP